MKKTRRNRMRTFLSIFLSAVMILSFNAVVFAADQTSSKTTSYKTITEVYDWGPSISKVIVDLGQLVSKDAIATDTFTVHVVRTEPRPKTMLLGDASGDRKVTKAYISDKDGNPVNAGNYATLEMEVGPDVALSSPMNFSLNNYMNYWIKCDYAITQQKDIKAVSGNLSGLVASTNAGNTMKLVDQYKVNSGTYDHITMAYSSYKPIAAKGKRPLIIWLHGMGEGGSDGLLPIAGNKAVNFASPDMQAYFDGAYVLAPQCPTMWMDGFKDFGDGTSKYENALMALIKDFVAKNNGIDPDRIYVGGDSNGGYMTMVLARDYSDYFAAAFPCCEALADKLITDADINKLASLPLWLIAAKTDTTVDPTQYEIPTFSRIQKAGAKNAHFSFFDKVVDTSGKYKKADGTPYEYAGHWSWIYVYNNECKDTINGKTTSIMEWLAAQTKSKTTDYSTVTEIKDWGAAVTKVIVNLKQEVTKYAITPDTFRVHVVRTENRPNTMMLGASVGDRKITKAYVSDKQGNPLTTGSYATLEMVIGPDDALGSPLNFSLNTYLNDWVTCDYTVYQQKSIRGIDCTIDGLVANVRSGDVKKLVDDFKVDHFTSDNITMTYASYVPQKDSSKHPLIIWLHGMGEGGTEGLLPISANKADIFASKDVQSKFNGAYVLVPQCPTMWMDGVKTFGDGTSKYENSLMALIKDYVAKNPDVDPNKIYVGGDSNGGYMTMVLARDYSSYFAAAFPCCEALSDNLISDGDITKLASIPLWLIAAKTDTTVNPTLCEIPTFARIQKAGAKDAHFSFFDKVADTSGKYKKADGTPYEYAGHWSWIYVYNNECKDTINGKQVTLFDWLAGQSLQK